ncbi:hypothetical protein [Haloarcula sp. JP-L23]|uniref:hypothetical protein n=1 Tax=Haloarcula sp. JP-L23 TaxID=2716717 RepID=UPI001D04B61D
MDLDFVERERTPEPATALGIQSYAAGLSLSSTVELLDSDVETAVFLVGGAKYFQTALQRIGLRFQTCRHGNRNAIERICRELKRRTSSFSNCFSHVEPETAENWLQSFARWHNAAN